MIERAIKWDSFSLDDFFPVDVIGVKRYRYPTSYATDPLPLREIGIPRDFVSPIRLAFPCENYQPRGNQCRLVWRAENPVNGHRWKPRDFIAVTCPKIRGARNIIRECKGSIKLNVSLYFVRKISTRQISLYKLENGGVIWLNIQLRYCAPIFSNETALLMDPAY